MQRCVLLTVCRSSLSELTAWWRCRWRRLPQDDALMAYVAPTKSRSFTRALRRFQGSGPNGMTVGEWYSAWSALVTFATPFRPQGAGELWHQNVEDARRDVVQRDVFARCFVRCTWALFLENNSRSLRLARRTQLAHIGHTINVIYLWTGQLEFNTHNELPHNLADYFRPKRGYGDN